MTFATMHFSEIEDMAKAAAVLFKEGVAFNTGRDSRGWYIELTGY